MTILILLVAAAAGLALGGAIALDGARTYIRLALVAEAFCAFVGAYALTLI